MAVSWTSFADQTSLLTVRNSINVFNNAVATESVTNDTRLSNLELNAVAINKGGLISIKQTIVNSIALTTTYSKIRLVDTLEIDRSNLHITFTPATDSWLINTGGVYKISYSGSMLANSGELITFNYNINGVPAIPIPPDFVGRGASPVALNNDGLFELTAGTVIYIQAKANVVTSITSSSGNLIIEKTVY